MHVAVDPSAETAPWRLQRVEGGVRVEGRLNTPDAESVVAELRKAISGIDHPLVDLSAIEQIDGGVAVLIRQELLARGAGGVRLRVSDRFAPLLAVYDALPPPYVPKARSPEGVLAHLGRATVQVADQLTSVLAFTGATVIATGRVLRHPRRGQWSEIPLLLERAGADALPIVVVINFLIGFVLAYMAARALEAFGANRYAADIVGIGMTRQLGPIMTSIIVCGRSGAAYTAELGSMKVDEEIDALRTLGLDPHGWLVVPRLCALILVVPALTVVADVVGMAGGLVVAQGSLGVPAVTYYNELVSALTAWDVKSGLIMSVAFAIAIGLVACEQGFAASGGPRGVGQRTTSTVVISLFAIVFLDAVITVLYRTFGLS